MRLMNLDEVIRGHNHFLAENEQAVAEESEHAARHAVEHVQLYPGFKPRTGKLQKNTRARVLRTKGGRLVRLTNSLGYADSIDGGARPHPIAARRAPYLVFQIKGRWIRTKKVNHPGNRPYKFAYRAITSSGRLLAQALQRRMSEMAGRF